ncbi:hypothetical protein LF41_865 [Lysobacter dokdonensis DS-58]|uniref:Secreted protein n=1 Tax=Lysobacter dokdonensis DS-58 TaxID=1300345 RepID=A0A0A2X4Z8_9GAMM|nr:hypothetical protein [Lysobacter dokdonensis]KGQ20329.1 hypothetical protein LF41_865 [Lysobacter dokdonensis DS-58]
MNRKLHNTVTALFATSGLLVLSLMAANPAPSTGASVLAPIVVQPAADSAPANAKLAKLAAQGQHAAAAAKRIEARAADLEARLAKAKNGNDALGEVLGFAAEAATLATIAAAMDGVEHPDTMAAVEEADTTPSKPARKRTSGRQSVAMPFYSFAPRG